MNNDEPKLIQIETAPFCTYCYVRYVLIQYATEKPICGHDALFDFSHLYTLKL